MSVVSCPSADYLFNLGRVYALTNQLLVLDEVQCSNPAHRFASYREPLRSTINVTAVQTAIEYEYRCTEYRFAEDEYDDNNRLTRSQRRGSRYIALKSCSASRPSAPAWISVR
jgi:hypothetical protein